MEERKVLEAEFHNNREIDEQNMSREEFEKKYPNKKLYSVTNLSHAYIDSIIKKWKGKKVLDYCCGAGGTAVRLAQLGCDVTGIDISEEEIKIARAAADNGGVSERCHFVVGDAEHTGFEDESFDCIVCMGVLHHVDLDAAYKEISRLLKKDGIVLGDEALANNPFFMMYRRKTPHLRTAWETNHILHVRDIQHAEKYFWKVDIKFFHMTVIAAVPLKNTFLFKPVRALLNGIDIILCSIPGLRNWAWQGIFTLEGKR